jgi:ParB family chromosome partitioning protein
LAALIEPDLGENEDRNGTHGLRTIPVESLEPGPLQPRGPIEPDGLDELVQSIRAHGVLQPILARPHPDSAGRYQIVAGERRWRAAQQAGLHEIPVLLRDFSDLDAASAALVENLQRQDLNSIEEAEGYRTLTAEFGLTQDAIASAIGKSRSHVANTLRLLNLPRSVQNDVRAGTLSAGHARALLAHPEPQRAALVVISRGLNVRQTESLASGATVRRAAGARTGRRPMDPDIAALEERLESALGMRIRVEPRGQRGAITIRYDNLDQLEGLVTRLLG